MLKAQSNQRWFPSSEQLKDPSALERSFRQLLTQHYDLQDRFAELHAKVHTPASGKSSGPPPGSGPSDTQILGLRVAPIDTATLVDGTKLTYVKKDGSFQFL
jgi:hypothetical protein